MCGSAMRIDAELTEGERHYTWFKCMNINCGSVFLVQKSLQKRPVVGTEAQTNAAG
jgi:hypothetical protein